LIPGGFWGKGGGRIVGRSIVGLLEMFGFGAGIGLVFGSSECKVDGFAAKGGFGRFAVDRTD
jgi:hypothetical protein